ncbi:hypothetical protein TCAL_07851 [Tigriopus californicus]|uniref:Protein quiver n=1 Tax=Tigriopus californicus TaxID=6832 RepID=A0A553PJA9_TIGCA|nr:uncharacterized protein LOC131890614 [Tigriopus californicus]TRY77775.1 hypothetical protein TCAL_07851 [Tigriopus californicus]
MKAGWWQPWMVGITLWGAMLIGNADSQTQSKSEQQIQCYACGLAKVHPENDVVGSYGTAIGKKMYNHSCTELLDNLKDGAVANRFMRTCPVGVKSCFGATGFYDHGDNDPSNDLHVQFLGCSEAKHQHSYGCDRDLQNVDIRDKAKRKIQVEIDVNLCFCSTHICNDPLGELLSSKAAIQTSPSVVPTLVMGFLVASGLRWNF